MRAQCTLRLATCDTTGMADDTPQALTPGELDIVLQRLPGWAVENNQLEKEFRFKDFIESLSFINRLLPFFELKDHHPDVHISKVSLGRLGDG